LSLCRYDRARCELKYVKDTQLLAAMAPPGGGRNHFSQRISACFSTINMTQPYDAQLRRIFSTLLNMKLSEFDDDVRPLAEPIVAASVEIYRAVSRELLPTPSKSHYLFNTRDLAKVVLGVMQVTAIVGWSPACLMPWTFAALAGGLQSNISGPYQVHARQNMSTEKATCSSCYAPPNPRFLGTSTTC